MDKAKLISILEKWEKATEFYDPIIEDDWVPIPFEGKIFIEKICQEIRRELKLEDEHNEKV